MSVILILILASLVMATVFLVGFIWSVRSGQYDDTTTPSIRVLMEEGDGQRPGRAGDQRLPLTVTLSRREREQQSPAPGSSTESPATADSHNSKSQCKNLSLPAAEGRGGREPHENQSRSPASEDHKRKTDFDNP